jgi:hypothetical protein
MADQEFHDPIVERLRRAVADREPVVDLDALLTRARAHRAAVKAAETSAEEDHVSEQADAYGPDRMPLMPLERLAQPLLDHEELGTAGRGERRHRSRVKAFLLWCSGVRRDVLDRTPTEEANYLGLGGSVLTTAVSAVVVFSVAFSIALQAPIWLAALIGIAWGLAIFNLDRWLVTTVGGASARARLVTFLPRIGLAVILAFMVTEPLLLGIFNAEVQSKMADLRAAQAVAQTSKIVAEDAPRLRQFDQQRTQLQQQLAAKEDRVQDLAQMASREMAGTTGTGLTGRAGQGPVAARLLKAYDLERKQLTALQQQTEQQLRRLQDQRRSIETKQASKSALAERTISGGSGLLLHIQALEALARDNSAMATTMWMVRLLIILIGSMPIIIRLLQSAVGRRSYDQMLAALQHDEELEATLVREHAELKVTLARAQAKREAMAARERAEIEARLARVWQEQFTAMWPDPGANKQVGSKRSRQKGPMGGTATSQA